MTEDTQQAIADDLGVSRKTVGRAIDELPEDVKRGQLTELNTEEKREQVREFVEDNPTGGTVSPVLLGSTDRYSARGSSPGSPAAVRWFAGKTELNSGVVRTDRSQ